MISIALLSSGALCVGSLEDDGSMNNVFVLLARPVTSPSSSTTITCILVSPFHPFEVETPIKKIDSQFIMCTKEAPTELASLYTSKTSGIVLARPSELDALSKIQKGLGKKS